MTPWLSIVGIGDDGLDGLAPSARALIDAAECFIGGERHLAMLPADNREKRAWPSPLTAIIDEIVSRRGTRLCVLATGDPMSYGVGVTLAKRIAISEMVIVPAPSAFSLACARLGWPLADVDTLTLHGRPLELLHPFIQPRARLLILSDSGATPAKVAQLLTERGFGGSSMTVLEHMGGPDEHCRSEHASSWDDVPSRDFNTIAVECIGGHDADVAPRVPGLPDSAFRHDGQLTKREVRAVTLSSLAPFPGALMWDIGAGCGSVAVEWMRSARGAAAICVERQAERRAMIADNALALGVPSLKVVAGTAPDGLAGLPTPDAVFIGGGISGDGLFEACWAALRPGGRLVANVVTLEGETRVSQLHGDYGGSLSRMSVSRANPVGPYIGWRPQMTVTQWQTSKPWI